MSLIRGEPAGPDSWESTKIRAKYLRALENEEFGLLPGPTFVQTFLRTYADYLGRDAQLLAACYENCIALACRYQLASIAFPAISTGAHGYPKSEAARVVRTAIVRAMQEPFISVRQVTLVFGSESDAAIMTT